MEKNFAAFPPAVLKVPPAGAAFAPFPPVLSGAYRENDTMEYCADTAPFPSPENEASAIDT